MDWNELATVATSEIALRVAWFLGGILLTGIIAMFGTLLFGRNYKKRFADMQAKIDELSSQPPTHMQQIVNITQASDGTFVSRIQSPRTRRPGTLVVIQMPERIARIGTKQGELQVPFGDKPEILYEIVMGLEKHDFLDVLDTPTQTSAHEPPE